MQSKHGLLGMCDVRKASSNSCERLTWFLKFAQAPTSNTGGVAELKAEQVKGRRAICASPQTNMNHLQHSQFHHASKQKTTSEEPWNAKTCKKEWWIERAEQGTINIYKDMFPYPPARIHPFPALFSTNAG